MGCHGIVQVAYRNDKLQCVLQFQLSSLMGSMVRAVLEGAKLLDDVENMPTRQLSLYRGLWGHAPVEILTDIRCMRCTLVDSVAYRSS